MKNLYKGGIFKVTSTYGNRDIGNGTEFHSGLDIVGISSKELLAICDGTVQQSRIITNKNNLTWQWGNYVCIKADTGELIFYCHLSKRLVNKGDRVKVGDVIGIEGNTGYSFGSHCHLEVRNASNKVTSKVNTPVYTEIPNVVQKIDITNKEDEPMTAAEKKEFDELKNKTSELEAKVVELEAELAKKENAEKVYRYWSEIKKLGGDLYTVLYAMYKAGYFHGASSKNLNISKTKLEALVIMGRALKANGLLNY